MFPADQANDVRAGGDNNSLLYGRMSEHVRVLCGSVIGHLPPTVCHGQGSVTARKTGPSLTSEPANQHHRSVVKRSRPGGSASRRRDAWQTSQLPLRPS